jgi:hypothetical protein
MARRGRPTKQPKSGEKASLGLKVTAEIKRRLEASARLSGRTQSQEAEWRLERSFDRQDLLSEFLEASYGPQVAGLLLLLGGTLHDVASIARALPLIARGGMSQDVVKSFSGAVWWEGWLDDPHAFNEAHKAIFTILDKLRPPGSPQPNEETVNAMKALGWENIGPRVAADFLRELRRHKPAAGKLSDAQFYLRTLLKTRSGEP